MNELDVRWVGEKSWTYRCKFVTPLQAEGVIGTLVFEGLDTFATVRLNGTEILKSDNMFIPYRVDITAHLISNATNVLEIDFDSALLRAREIRKQHPEHRYIGHQGEPERIGVRKAQCHWGWDWGPKLMCAGPWRPVRLETFTGRLEHLCIESTLSNDYQECTGRISVECIGHGGDQVQFVIKTEDGNQVFESRTKINSTGSTNVAFNVQKPCLWYPHGYGAQNLYIVEAVLLESNLVVHSVEKRIAFRRAELIQEKDAYGKSFYFKINGIDIFAGGSCWIPADSFIPRISADKYRQWLTLMVESNQIMTR